MTSYTALSDQELAALLRDGNQAAFKVIYQRYWEKLLAVAARRLNDQEEGEEALQDIFLNLWKRREGFILRVSFDHYFSVALKFEVINRLGKRVKENTRNLAYADQLSREDSRVFEKLDFDLLQKQLEDTICSLPEKCQLVFRMSREQELTNKEIASKLGVSEKAVEKHKTNALKVLRARFGHHLQVILILF